MEQIAYLIARFLKERGADRVFSLCGGHILPIWDHLYRLGIRIIDVRDERAAVHMAHAHRELTGRLGVAVVTAGPGMTNAVTGIANAYISRVPILVIAGVPPRPQQGMGALQSIPQVDMVRCITRYARTISSAEHVLRELDEAVACTEGHCGEPGPAFLDFPTDVLRENIPDSLIDSMRFRARETAVIPPSAERIRAAAALLAKSKRPLVISGRGARGGQESLLNFLEVFRCIYLDTPESRGLVPEDHPLFMPAMRGRAMREADLVFTIGRSLDFQLAYGSKAVFPEAHFIRTGTTPGELRGNRRSEEELFGSPTAVLDALAEIMEDSITETDHRWIQEMQLADRQSRQRLLKNLREMPPGEDGAMHPYRLLGCVREKLDRNAVVIADGGDFLSFARIALTGSAYLDCGPFGCLGVGVPFGIAAALALPDRQVVVMSGDGSFGFNAIELDTCRRHKARVVFIVANNGGWNIERSDQKLSFGGRIVGTELEGCDYAGLARSMGVQGQRVESPEQLPAAVERAFSNAPALLDVVVTRDAVSPDGVSGLPVVPDTQALAAWDDLEKARRNKF
jgi:thiamine pyrophosphate-dependent acetolactate synthase large subunit-like protein